MNTFILKQKMLPNIYIFCLFFYCQDLHGRDVTVTGLNVCFYPATMWVLPDIAYILAA